MSKLYRYGFDRCATEAEVKERKRRLSVLLHPDKGGDADLFAAMLAESEARLGELGGGAGGDGFSLGDVAERLLRSDAVKDIIAQEVRRRIPPKTAQFIKDILQTI